MDGAELILLYDYYGSLLTDRQRECFELRHNQDFSLGEIATELGISRQGVHDNLSRAEALLKNMEAKTGCVSRDRSCRNAAHQILALAQKLDSCSDPQIREAAAAIRAIAKNLEE